MNSLTGNVGFKFELTIHIERGEEYIHIYKGEAPVLEEQITDVRGVGESPG